MRGFDGINGAKVNTTTPQRLCQEDFEGARPRHRLPGRNTTKADIEFYALPAGRVALKNYRRRPWLVRQTVGRFLIRREVRAYVAAGSAPGLAPFLGRVGPFALATSWLDARPLAEHVEGRVAAAPLTLLEQVVRGLHERGVALADLNHRDVLLGQDGSVHVIDLALACVKGSHPGPLRRRMFERACAADRFALARLRARYGGEDRATAIASADPAARAWHRRMRRIKWCWDRLRGAPRLPPVDDHWRF